MKKSTLLVSFTFFVFWNNLIFCQNLWKYPIVHGTKEWAELKSEKEIIAVQQIPENLLREMTTEEVFRAWIDLPSRMEILAFNTMQLGFDEIRRRYNVLNELLIRKDVGAVVIKYYSIMKPTDLMNEWESKTKGKFITDFALLEFLISQPEVLASLAKTQKKYLFDRSKQNLEEKMNLSEEDLDFFWISSGLVLAGRILEEESFQSQKEVIEPLRRGEIVLMDEFEILNKWINENEY